MTIRIDRVVTRGGDAGQTSLGDGTRVSKNSTRIEAMGCLDELNAVVGLLRSHLPPESAEAGQLAHLQNRLFDMGADLCQPEQPGEGDADGAGAPERRHRATRLGAEAVPELEGWIEQMRAVQAPLTSFVLPGGTQAAAWAHLARTQARTTERRVVALAQHEALNPELLKMLNRLSDYFFVLARHFNQHGRTDVLWTPAARRGQV
ncbi:cob(I)yrinic acid a,c-diamide adenosyltransferase [Acetobacter farinalis]|uniref:Corrinoid adenosyltransferase n=1 Tax=Acetobacter farinalis TaxID=1260984 RepID=A0ABT3Q3P1_9PROT|nr:cob(I)yrinic acid a,c-diamide adenosyltransferase [Acetobacter farinalis]MCX2559901.1 cob(I)yrinic acid a,c-diamide adenosyltransferase [Acetobacter farinalis]NHO28562.1 cob(I)yrinic acid a,c-diamide adenosyltransferase [Acetobacter farinalis]